MLSDSAKRSAPAALRNREPIRDVLRGVLPERGQVLEIGSGTGEHAVFFAASFPEIVWQPTDAEPDCLASIAAVDKAAAQGLHIRRLVIVDALACGLETMG